MDTVEIRELSVRHAMTFYDRVPCTTEKLLETADKIAAFILEGKVPERG